MAQEVCSGVAYRKKAKDGDQPRSISDERLKPHTGKGLTEPLQVLRHTVSTPIPLFSSGPVPCKAFTSVVKSLLWWKLLLELGFPIGLGREEIMYLACPVFG